MKEEFSNIFEAASKQRPSTPKRPPAAASQPTPSAAKAEDASPPKPPVSLESVEEMLEHMQRLELEITDKLNILYTQSGLSPAKVRKFIEDSGGQKTIEWMKTQRERKNLEDRLWGVLGLHAKARLAQQKEAKAQKTRKAKSIGARQRWIRVE